MGQSSFGSRPDEFEQATRHAFARCPRVRGLRLVFVAVRDGTLTAHFEGPQDDFRGPYGAVIRLPKDRQDPLWTVHADPDEGTIPDWVHAGVAMRSVEAHRTSLRQDRSFSTDNIWWLIDDTADTADTSDDA